MHEDPVAHPPETMVMEIMTEAGAVIFDSSFVKKQWEGYIEQVRKRTEKFLLSMLFVEDVGIPSRRGGNTGGKFDSVIKGDCFRRVRHHDVDPPDLPASEPRKRCTLRR